MAVDMRPFEKKVEEKKYVHENLFNEKICPKCGKEFKKQLTMHMRFCNGEKG